MVDDEYANVAPQGPRFKRILEGQPKGPSDIYARKARPVPNGLHDAIGKAVMEVVARGKESWHQQEGALGLARFAPEPPLTISMDDMNHVARTAGLHYDMAGVIRYHFARHGIELLDCEVGAPSATQEAAFDVHLNVGEAAYAKLKPAAEAAAAAEQVGARLKQKRGRA